MKIVFIGYDYTLDLATQLLESGQKIVKIYTFPCDNVFAFNTQIKDFAAYHGIPITEERITEQDIANDIALGTQMFLSAGYPYKIAPIDEEKAFALNMHPTYLPYARGMMPLPHVILNEPHAAGFTFHKIAANYDSGDIIYQEKIAIDETTDVETLSARIALRANAKINTIMQDIENLWKNSTPQDTQLATQAFLPDEATRTIDWDNTSQTLNMQSKAFGRFGMIAHIKNNIGQTQKLAVYQFSTWSEPHDLETGRLLRSSAKEVVVSIKDGFACLKDFTPIH